MAQKSDWDDKHERITSSGHGRPLTDLDHTVGQLMAENLNHRRRIEVLEKRVEDLEAPARNQSLTAKRSVFAFAKHPLFVLVRKATLYTVIAIAAVISALKELGFLTK